MAAKGTVLEIVAAGGNFLGVGAGDELFDATPRVGVDVDELDGHAHAGLDAADHAGDDEGFGGTQREAKFDGFAALKGTGIENEEAAGGEVANARDRREILDGDFLAGHARL